MNKSRRIKKKEEKKKQKMKKRKKIMDYEKNEA